MVTVLGVPRTMHFLLSHWTIGVRKLLKELTYTLGRLPDAPLKTPIRSARETSSAMDRTCIFSITLWRWALMVRSVAPNALPTCLFV